MWDFPKEVSIYDIDDKHIERRHIMITFTDKNSVPEKKDIKVIETDNDKLVFPERTITITDRWGKIEKIKTRQKTIYRNGRAEIWTDADIVYYEKLQEKIKELQEIDQMSLNKSIEELINEPETV